MSCIFCRIAQGEIPADLLYQDEEVVAFADIDPKAPSHVLVIPRQHIASVQAVGADQAVLLGRMVLAAQAVARQLGVDATGYRLVMNHGRDGGQSVDHLHMHLLGGRRMAWPPG